MNLFSVGLFAQQQFKFEEMEAGGGGIPTWMIVLYVAVLVVIIAGIWKMFTKAGEPGWACIVPIYNIIVMLRIAGMPLWWLIVMLIPLVSIIPAFMLPFKTAERFGKGAGFAIGMIFLPFIFYPILGFGDARYTPPPPAR
jgi:hypothetical protein